MKNDNTNVRITGGISAIDLLQIVFIVLKLCGVIKWSWVWVLAPLWISTILAIVIIVIAIIIIKISS